MESEEDLYPNIRREIERLLRKTWDAPGVEIRIHLEETYKGSSATIENAILDQTAQQFLKHLPDIAGYINIYVKSEDNSVKLPVVVEVKDKKIHLDDLYQLIKYSDLYKSYLSILVTTEEIPEDITDFVSERLAPIEHQRDNYEKTSRLTSPRGVVLLRYGKHINEFIKIYTHRYGVERFANTIAEEI